MNTRFPMRGRFKQTTLQNVSSGENQWTFGTTVPQMPGISVGDVYAMLPPAPFSSNSYTAQWPLYLWVWDGTQWDLFANANATSATDSSLWASDSYFNSNIAGFNLFSSYAVNGKMLSSTFADTELQQYYTFINFVN